MKRSQRTGKNLGGHGFLGRTTAAAVQKNLATQSEAGVIRNTKFSHSVQYQYIED